jgi:hypothetical protein
VVDGHAYGRMRLSDVDVSVKLQFAAADRPRL